MKGPGDREHRGKSHSKAVPKTLVCILCGGMRQQPLLPAGYPLPPDSGRIFICCMSLARVRAAKFLCPLKLFTDSSQQRSYGVFCGFLCSRDSVHGEVHGQCSDSIMRLEGEIFCNGASEREHRGRERETTAGSSTPLRFAQNDGAQPCLAVRAGDADGGQVARHFAVDEGGAVIGVAEVHLEVEPGAVLQDAHVPRA